MNLFENAAHSRFVWADDNEQIFAEKSKLGIGVDDLNVGQVLAICADLILTLYDQYASVAQHSMSLATAILVEFYNRSVPLPATVPRCLMPVGIVISKGIVCPRACFDRVPTAKNPSM